VAWAFLELYVVKFNVVPYDASSTPYTKAFIAFAVSCKIKELGTYVSFNVYKCIFSTLLTC
jgi:hypothetical protein